MVDINNLYPHLKLYNEYINNNDIANASNLLQHNDELAKYIQDQKQESNFMTSNDVTNYISNQISNGKLLSSNAPMLSNSPTWDTGLGGSIWETNLHEDYDEIKQVSTCGYTSDLIRKLLPTIWKIDYDSWNLEIDGVIESSIHPLYDSGGMIEYLKKYYVKVNDFILTSDNVLYRITNITNIFGQIDAYSTVPINKSDVRIGDATNSAVHLIFSQGNIDNSYNITYGTSLPTGTEDLNIDGHHVLISNNTALTDVINNETITLTAQNGTSYNISVSNEGQIIVNPIIIAV